MKPRKIAAVGTAAVLVLGGGVLAGCGGGEPTAQDMKDWQASVRSDENLHDLAAMNETDLAAGCAEAADKYRSALDGVDDPPYKGEEWRSTVNETLDVVDTACDAFDEGNFGKLMLIEPKMTEVDNQMKRWVADVNKEFPSLNWNADTYLVQ